MGITPLSIKENYWDNFEILEEDMEFLYNHLLEIENPLTPQELLTALVKERIRQEKDNLEDMQLQGGTVYLPKEQHTPGQSLQFPALNWQKGQVLQVRPGNNPEVANFNVIEVEFEDGEKRQFASGLGDHFLNEPVAINVDDPLLRADYVLENYGDRLIDNLTEQLETSPDLVRIAGRWFPRALLVDIHAGHLNLAEAILEVEEGGPLTTEALAEQLDLPKDESQKLIEFSLNLALQEDERFDEVGPAGQILWYLRRLEPDEVLQPPQPIRYNPIPFDQELVAPLLAQFEGQIVDELEDWKVSKAKVDEISIPLLYPHLRAGTLPLSDQVSRLFPTAYETPRIQFTFVDGETNEKISGWVVRSHRYVYGLREWFERQNLIPGSLVTIARSPNPGEVVIKSGRKRSTREWIRTALIGSDGGLVFSLLKHNLATTIDERMAIVISDQTALDQLWLSRQKGSLPTIVKTLMRELAKLSPQGHIHAQELYAAVNVLRRCPPGPILSILLENSWAVHLGDLYFRLDESSTTEE